MSTANPHLQPAAHNRRYKVTHRLLPVFAVLCAGAFVFGLVKGGTFVGQGQKNAEAFARAWQKGDYTTMYGLVSGSSKKATSQARFKKAYETARDTATATAFTPGKSKEQGEAIVIPIAVGTRVFGIVRDPLVLPIAGDDKISWKPNLTFPGVPQGATLTRNTTLPNRAKIVSRDGKTLVTGPAGGRTTPGGAAADIAGTVGPAKTRADKRFLFARGFPESAPIGQNGLERALEDQVAGRAGGRLLAGRKVLATAKARPAGTVKSTIDTRIQQAAVTSLGGRMGGVAALDPDTGEVRALAGAAFSAPQPPGSTFKLITTTAALAAGKVTLKDSFPVQTKAVLEGVDLENANGESCGGSLANSFAESCNSVFAPIGVKVGKDKLVETAEKYGFNEKPTIPGALESSIPRASQLGDALDVGSTAIGQGKVLATPLEMASVAQTIANGGVRKPPTLVPGAGFRGIRVSTAKVARTMEQLMIGVVKYGTGTAAQLDPIKVAGKTGTAELQSTQGAASQGASGDIQQDPGVDTDAWFTAYAPTRKPKIVAAALFIRAGAGGDVAAPAVKGVLQAGLKAK